MDTPSHIEIPQNMPMMLALKGLKEKIYTKRNNIVSIIQEEFYMRLIGDEMYQVAWILDQFKGVNADMLLILNEIADIPPEEVGFHNGNKLILQEHKLEYFIQIRHNGDDHGQYDDINDIPHGN